MATERHLALYGNIGLERGYCDFCKTTCIILHSVLQCCGRKIDEIEASLLPTKRMSVPEYRRNRLGKKKRDMILNSQNNKCIYCGRYFGSFYKRRTAIKKTIVHIDHIIPFAYSANNDDENLVAACNICNLMKKDKIFSSLEEVTLYVTEKTKEKIFLFSKHCLLCRKGFQTRNKRKLFCSDPCRNKKWITEHPRIKKEEYVEN